MGLPTKSLFVALHVFFLYLQQWVLGGRLASLQYQPGLCRHRLSSSAKSDTEFPRHTLVLRHNYS